MGRRSAGSVPAPVRELTDFDRLIDDRLRARAADDSVHPAPSPESPSVPAPSGQTGSGQAPDAAAPSRLDLPDRPLRAKKPRGTVLDWISLVFAILVPPLGLLLNVVSRIASRHRHGWTTSVAAVVTVLSIVFTLLLGVGILAYSVVAEREAAEAQVLAEAQPLCTAIEATPGALDLPAFGWPTEVAAIPVTLEAMRAYQLHWQQLSDLAPASAKANLQAVADQAQTLVVSVEANQAIDRNGNLATMSSVTGATGLPGWVATHCA